MPKLIYPFVFMEICFSGQRSKPHTHYFHRAAQCLWNDESHLLHYILVSVTQLCFPVVWEQGQEQNPLPCSHLSSPARTGRNISITVWPDSPSFVCNERVNICDPNMETHFKLAENCFLILALEDFLWNHLPCTLGTLPLYICRITIIWILLCNLIHFSILKN